MFGIGPMEMIAILVVALIIFGPQRLPEIGAQVGKAIRDFRRMSDDVTGEFQRTMTLDEPPPARTLTPTPVSGQEGAAGHSNGSHEVADTLGQALVAQTIPSEAPGSDLHTEVPPVASAETVGADGAEGMPVTPVATKADPLAGASFLDAPVATTTATEDDTPAAGETYVYRPTPIPGADEPLNVYMEPVATTEGDAVRTWSLDTAAPPSASADAWAAVATTEATAPLLVTTVPDESDETAQPVGVAVATDAERERGDEESIHDKVEAQVASSFQERRRRAVYNRPRK